MSSLHIGIIGLGLMGGSLAKAIREKCAPSLITAYDIHETSLNQALGEGVIDAISDDDYKAFGSCDLIFLCAPVQKNMVSLKKLIAVTPSTCVITDIGSTKKEIIDLAKTLDCHHFIGGHPMTGSEKSGIIASNSHLYENAYYILTPTPQTPDGMTKLLSSIITEIGALPIIVEPEDHDYITATISHVPHLIASSMVNMVKKLDNTKGQMHTLAAGGFKDITRIASSSPDMWQQICLTNKHKIMDIIDCFQNELKSIKEHIQQNHSEEIWHFFADSRDYRNSFSDHATGSIIKTYKVTVDVVDEPGIIAKIATVLSHNGINIKNIGINNNREHEEGVLEILFYDAHSRDMSIQILTGMAYKIYQ